MHEMESIPNFLSTDNTHIARNQKVVQIWSFLAFISMDIIVVVCCLIAWKLLWVAYGGLSLRIVNKENGSKHSIAVQNKIPLMKYLRCIHDLVKDLMWLNCEIINECGYQAFTYLYFTRRMMQLMVIISITDLSLWLPYMGYFSYNNKNEFSLNSMRSQGNDLFRTMYTIWVASITIYSLIDMRNYLYSQLKFWLFRQDPNKAILNNLLTKTVNIQFTSDKQSSLRQIRIRLLKQFSIQDRVIAIFGVPDYSQQLNLNFKREIYNIVNNINPNNLSCLWRLFKLKNTRLLKKQLEEAQNIIRKNNEQTLQLYKIGSLQNKPISVNSYFVIFQNIQTAQYLCSKYTTQRAFSSICPDCSYVQQDQSQQQIEQIQHKHQNKMIVNWAQDPNDLIWINMKSHRVQICKYYLFNMLCLILILFSIIFIALNTSSHPIIDLPSVLLPLFIKSVNSSIRVLIAKSSEWMNLTLQSETQLRQYTITVTYLIINVVVGSILRDTLNLLEVLKSGWGWLQLINLIYRSVDGLFYYLLIINEAAFSFESSLVKTVDLMFDAFQVRIYYQKLLKIKSISKYGINQTFRYGQCYAIDTTILTIILLYSTCCPLIHVSGILYFIVRLYTNTYNLISMHRITQTSSHMRLIDKVILTIQYIVLVWVILSGTTMLFQHSYSNVIVLYLYAACLTYYFYYFKPKINLSDHITDHQIHHVYLNPIIQQWKKLFNPISSNNHNYLQSNL